MARGILALSGALILAACSSGGGSTSGGGGGTVVTPTPTPTPAPSPTPTPVASYTKFADLTGDQNFTSACSAINIGSPPTLFPATIPDNGLTFAYAAGPQTWSIGGDGLALTFTPAERETGLPSSVVGYAKVGPPTERLRLSLTGTVSTPAEYMRLASVTARVPGGSLRNYACIIGVRTRVTDVPPGTLFTFPGARLNGFLYRGPSGGGATTQLNPSASTVSIEVNLSTGTVTTTIHLIGSALPSGSGPDVDLGTLVGAADIDPATGGYYGTTWTSPDMSVLFAQFGGGFFGPQGRETGYAITLLADRPDGTRIFLSGSVAGVR